ncbi:polyketide cyclase [Nocardioides mangrovicus]|uniref:Polyketide cyclase n=1 Tax=Nocardioides mangrovicus TaxID=2478913 RepID=A0A3L8P7E0_9ACTN|nr:SRPBCC family protein [Nocardioides mangrovicus]RLV51054.1 polyketide cyclase [Nocardioides mangrovicus]
MTDRLEVSRTIAAAPAEIFAVLTDPQGHVAIDGSGMLQDADGERVRAVGDEFVVHMDRESLGDIDWKLYDVTVHITTYEQDRELAWSIIGRMKPPIGHVYGYRLEPADGGTLVTSYCDWSDLHEDWRGKLPFPIVPEANLKATLGILDRTVRRGYVGQTAV